MILRYNYCGLNLHTKPNENYVDCILVLKMNRQMTLLLR